MIASASVSMQSAGRPGSRSAVRVSSPRTRVVFGDGALDRLGELARRAAASPARCSSPTRAWSSAGYVERAPRACWPRPGIDVVRASTTSTPTPTAAWSRPGAAVAAARQSTRIVALGGGSSLDCAKGINFLLTGGGAMRDYRGFGKARGRCCRRSASRRRPAPAARHRATRSFPTPRRTRRWPAGTRRRRSASRFSIPR